MMPTNYLLRLDKKLLTTIKLIGRKADELNMRAYLVGGIVRDLILGRKNFDLDIVVEADALLLCQKLERTLKAKARFYKQFGTATLDLKTGGRIDFASARQETYPEPGSLPVVKMAILNEDLFRRDFTINAMAIAINAGAWGALSDPWGGFDDLRKGQIRVMHLQSFVDDPTRILRAIRFEQRFGFHIEKETLELMQKALSENVYHTVKPPRLFVEFKKILQEKDPLLNLKRTNELSAMQFVCSTPTLDLELVSKMGRCIHNLKLVKPRIHPWLVYAIALLESLSQDQREEVLQKFPFTKEEKNSILQSSALPSILKRLSSSQLKSSDVYTCLKVLSLETIIVMYGKTKDRLVKSRLRDYLERTSRITIALRGDDLKTMGFESNKYMGETLEKILLKKIDKKIHSKAQEIQYAKELLECAK
jgi:tRNA nucleotidyltransferase (CCA-adding enzyme)